MTTSNTLAMITTAFAYQTFIASHSPGRKQSGYFVARMLTTSRSGVGGLG